MPRTMRTARRSTGGAPAIPPPCVKPAAVDISLSKQSRVIEQRSEEELRKLLQNQLAVHGKEAGKHVYMDSFIHEDWKEGFKICLEFFKENGITDLGWYIWHLAYHTLKNDLSDYYVEMLLRATFLNMEWYSPLHDCRWKGRWDLVKLALMRNEIPIHQFIRDFWFRDLHMSFIRSMYIPPLPMDVMLLILSHPTMNEETFQICLMWATKYYPEHLPWMYRHPFYNAEEIKTWLFNSGGWHRDDLREEESELVNLLCAPGQEWAVDYFKSLRVPLPPKLQQFLEDPEGFKFRLDAPYRLHLQKEEAADYLSLNVFLSDGLLAMKKK